MPFEIICIRHRVVFLTYYTVLYDYLDMKQFELETSVCVRSHLYIYS